ncbi:hypothetical protein PGTUg99_036350 [Puccinia graminis f. sp. tritici]|uniref:Uncharacterized protein n=1 Tax=Puccinia graminis f. sp. tritici TaxID=56615 RepID=A0A5B0RPW0_PUCGR|nr:hypothetical protein PGTUg99_036350 [Puccinia graminis f. sp. tritici]
MNNSQPQSNPNRKRKRETMNQNAGEEQQQEEGQGAGQPLPSSLSNGGPIDRDAQGLGLFPPKSTFGPSPTEFTQSFDAPPVKVSDYVSTIPSDRHLVVVVGAMADGADDFADHLVDEKIVISRNSLSASVACY